MIDGNSWTPSGVHSVEMTSSVMKESVKKRTMRYQDYLCGWGAAVINITATFPVNKVMFRQQLHGISVKSAIRQLHKEGLLNLYRGLMPPLMQKSSCMAIMFGSYQEYRYLLREHAPHMPGLANKLSAAMLAGTTEAILVPFERIQTLLQDKRYHGQFNNTIHSFRALRSYGVREYYRGLSAILLRNGPSNCLFFVFRGKIKELFPQTDIPSYIIMQDFVSGALLGSCISTLFFPINVAKTRMQSQLGGEFVSARQAFSAVYNERNRSWAKIFRGAQVNFTRSLLSWGIINASYELLLRHVFYSEPRNS